MLFGLGWPQWLTIAALVGGLILTFWVMARASIAYENARRARERDRGGESAAESLVNDKKES